MSKAIATYNAPDGDNKVVEMGGVTFYDGQSVELDTEKHGHMVNKMHGNQHFDISLEGDNEVPTDDAGDDLDGKNIADLRALAEARGIDHDGLSKANLREALRS